MKTMEILDNAVRSYGFEHPCIIELSRMYEDGASADELARFVAEASWMDDELDE